MDTTPCDTPPIKEYNAEYANHIKTIDYPYKCFNAMFTGNSSTGNSKCQHLPVNGQRHYYAPYRVTGSPERMARMKGTSTGCS